MNNITGTTTKTEKLKEENERLKQENKLQQQQIDELSAKLNWFMEQYRISKHKQFGRSSEQTNPEQINLFNEAEVEAKPDLKEPTVEEITYKRRKSKGHREEILKDLPVEVIEYHLPEEDRVCFCGNKMHKMSTQVRKELKIIPPQVTVVEHVQDVYGCRHCEKNEITTPIKISPMPTPAFPGSLASPSSMAYIMSQKFVEGLPLYRQEKQWERLGVKISRQTMANWMIKGSQQWLQHLYEKMKGHLLKKDIIHADETTLQVLHEEGRPASSKSYMWLYRTGRDGPPIILYDYKTTRAGKHPKTFLEDFKGYLHVDGYDGYNSVSNVTLVGCWAHARRKFDEALKALPAKRKSTPTAAQEGLDYCNKLFEIERTLKNVTPEERYEARLKLSRPVLDDFLSWLKYQTPRVLPKSALGKAIKYCRNQWEKLEAFLMDGRLEISNNRSERSIKPFVIGRKAWLFNNTAKGANASATIYSIIETAKENGLNPFEYLKFIFETLPNVDINSMDEIDSFLPWSPELPDVCHVKK